MVRSFRVIILLYDRNKQGEDQMGKALLKVGKFYSAVVMKNIGIFITLGLLRVLFMTGGWIANAQLYGFADVVYQTVLPILIAYTCGKKIGEEFGGVVAAVSMVGVITTEHISGVMGAMILGPVAGYFTKKVETFLKDKIPTGTEMLIRNLVIGLLGIILMLAGYYRLVPVLQVLEDVLSRGIDMMVQQHVLPILALIVEPAKLLFLNNSINHGILVPLAMEQVHNAGKSILFLIETNPGPGFGILLAFFVWQKEKRKINSSYLVIQLIGGIHEVYFPFVLLHPWLILVVILSGGTGILIFDILNTGLVGVASPGSILTLLLAAPKDEWYKVLLGVLVSTCISFFGAMIVLQLEKRKHEKQSVEIAKKEIEGMNSKMSKLEEECKIPQRIFFICDGGFGSSAMGAALFRKKLKKENITGIQVSHASIEEFPENADLVFVQKNLKDKIAGTKEGIEYYYLDNFLDTPEFSILMESWKEIQRRENK